MRARGRTLRDVAAARGSSVGRGHGDTRPHAVRPRLRRSGHLFPPPEQLCVLRSKLLRQAQGCGTGTGNACAAVVTPAPAHALPAPAPPLPRHARICLSVCSARTPLGSPAGPLLTVITRVAAACFLSLLTHAWPTPPVRRAPCRPSPCCVCGDACTSHGARRGRALQTGPRGGTFASPTRPRPRPARPSTASLTAARRRPSPPPRGRRRAPCRRTTCGATTRRVEAPAAR